MAKKKKITNWYRKVLQYAIVALLAYMVIRAMVQPGYFVDVEAYCPFGGMLALNSFLVNNSLACSMTEVQIFMGIALLAGIVMVGKLFCSYLCPLGTFSEWLGRWGEKWKVRYTITGLGDRLLRSLKYGLLFITFYFTVGSSELFCREYDPFFATFAGFSGDVVVWYAVPALAILVLGAVFIRQFWCKYLCPLGAISNIFANAALFVGVMAAFFVLNWAGLEISWIWPVAIISLGGFILESVRMEGWLFPPLKITRNEATCTSCKKCDKACPMAIDVSTVDVVKHIDCHLCGDCITSCPEKDVLQINRKEVRWLPATATVGLIVIGLILALQVELPTINLRWGDDTAISQAAMFSQSGLKNVKCYGSSMSFANQIKRVPGVLGVDTYVKTHTVNVLYDSSKTSGDDIRKAIFSPARTLLRQPDAALDSVDVVAVGIEKLFDSYDSFYLGQLLRSSEGIFGFETSYGEPVLTSVYYDKTLFNPDSLVALIESPEVTYVSRGKKVVQPLGFEVETNELVYSRVSRLEFVQRLFSPYRQGFNNFKQYTADQLSVYRIPMLQATNPSLKRQMQYLVSHISTNDDIVYFETVYEDQPYAKVYFLKDKLTETELYHEISDDSLTVHYSDGRTSKVVNPFRFPDPGLIIASEK